MRKIVIGFLVLMAMTFAGISVFAQDQMNNPAAPAATAPSGGEKEKAVKPEKSHAVKIEGEVTKIDSEKMMIMVTDKSDNKTPVKVSNKMLKKVKMGDTVKIWLKPDSVTAKKIKVLKKAPKVEAE